MSTQTDFPGSPLPTLLCIYCDDILLLQKGASGKDLFDAVKDKLQLSEEADYFSISHKDAKYNIRVCRPRPSYIL